MIASIRAWQAENAEIVAQGAVHEGTSSRSSRTFIEISGGINPENILSYLKLEPDFISTSYVSKNAHSIDLSMLITPQKHCI